MPFYFRKSRDFFTLQSGPDIELNVFDVFPVISVLQYGKFNFLRLFNFLAAFEHRYRRSIN